MGHTKRVALRIFRILVYLLILIGIIDTLLFTHIFTAFTVIKVQEIEDNLVPLLPQNAEDACPLMQVYDDTELLIPNITEVYDDKAVANDLNIEQGGIWYPTDCQARHSVAIIIPFRNREEHLRIFIPYIHQFLQHQFIRYQIFVIEQSELKEFNRGKLFNVGYLEVKKVNRFPCLILHDVDLLPQNINNIYGCTKYPRHMASNINKLRYVLTYDTYFGGVISILSFQYKYVNGFSNVFYGWGGEDDDFFNRVRNQKYDVCRFEPSVQTYYALSHRKERASDKRYEVLHDGYRRFHTDGLNNVTYKVKYKKYLPLYTKILVDI